MGLTEPATTFSDRRTRKQFIEGELLREAPRLLSAMDRCPASASGGCLDREYWAWATKDFSNTDAQRGLLVLAYLYCTAFPGNVYHGRRAVLQWIELGLRFWLRHRGKAGSFDHLYVNENSWMAAGFGLADLVEMFRLISHEMGAELRADWLQAMEQTGRFLLSNEELHGFISNHRAGAAAGLLGLAGLTDQDVFRRRAWSLMEEVYARQSSEGWFLEYEGADPGYQTLDVHYQARFYRYADRREKVISAVRKSLEFLGYFLHPDGSIGGEYGSRNCPHFFPGGLEVFAETLPLAEAMARLGTEGLATGQSCGLADADARNSIPLANSYVLAHQALCEEGRYEAADLPWERTLERLWPEAGLYVRSDRTRYVIFGASKGGVVKVFDKRRRCLLYSSCGYTGCLADGTHVTSHLWTTSPRLEAGGLRPGEEQELAPSRTISVEVPFYRFRPQRLMSPLKLLLFRAFNLTLGRLRMANDFLRRHLIIGRFLKARKRVPIILTRSLTLDGANAPEIEDTIEGTAGRGLSDLREHGFFSTVYMASARYFRLQDLAHAWSSEDLSGSAVGGRITRRTVIDAPASTTGRDAS